MRGQRQGIRSTKTKKTSEDVSKPALAEKNDIMMDTYDANETMYTDQTGCFPHTSSRGNRYQMIAFHVDSNSIWVDPMKNRTEGEMIQARERILRRMKACKIIPRHQIMDNEASEAYISAIQQSDMTYEKVPPDDH